MKKISALSVLLFLTQGCALSTGLTEGLVQAGRTPRPDVADMVHASGQAGARPHFGRTLPGVPPTNLPLPRTAIPGEYFRVPELHEKTKEAVFSSVDGAIEGVCALLSGMYGSTDPNCHRRPLHDRVMSKRGRPTVNR